MSTVHKAFEIYESTWEMTDDPFAGVDLSLTHEKETNRVRASLNLDRWRTCDDLADYLYWAADQVLKFKDLKEG